ncbi:MAG: hypothetical protein LBD42_06445 [Desulfovibrio sp.]|jgi:predicted exporter|nr:hypothetical protein [Desulfovibrio sp.]
MKSLPRPSALGSLPGVAHAWLYRRRGAVLIALGLVFALCAFAGAGLRLDMGSRIFFPDAAKAGRMAAALESTPFSRLLLVELSSDAPGREAELAAVASRLLADIPSDLAEQASRPTIPDPTAMLRLLPYLVDAQALDELRQSILPESIGYALHEVRNAIGALWGGAASAWARADPLNFRRIVFRRLPSPEGAFFPDPVLGYPISRDGRHLLLVLRPTRSLHDVEAATRLIAVLEHSLAAHLPPGVESRIAGGYRHTAANARAINGDIGFLATGSLIGIALVYLILVRSVGMIWLLLAPVAAATLALGAVSLAFPVFSGLALGFGASVLGIAEDYATHVHFALRSGQGARRALDAVMPSLFFGCLINNAGFGVLLFSGIPAVRDVAVFAILTLGAGFLLAVFILPLCPFADMPVFPPRPLASRRLQPVGRRVACCVAALAALCLFSLHRLDVDISPRTMGADAAAIRQDAEELRQRWAGPEKTVLFVGAANLPDALACARRITGSIRAASPASAVAGISDILPDGATAHDNSERWALFLEQHRAAILARLGEQASEAGFSPHAFTDFAAVLVPAREEASPALLRDAGLGEILSLFCPPQQDGTGGTLLFVSGPLDLAALPAELQGCVTPVSSSAIEEHLLGQLHREKKLVPIAWCLCLAILLLCFRNIVKAALAAIPPLCAGTCVLAYLTMTATPMTLAAGAALTMVIGLAADHGITAVHEMEHDFDAGGRRAMMVASLTTLAGMGMLICASHPALKAMGEVVFCGLLAEAPAAVWLLPLLCRKAAIGASQAC